MPKLGRLRFVSIGHPNARMQDLTLNLSDLSGLPSDSTIWLRNGGGKSSILSLFFALLRPNRRDFLGSKADAKQRRLENYILPNDRSVVAAEWATDTQDGLMSDESAPIPRMLTGVFYEYASGVRDNLRRLFFSVKVSDDVPETQLATIPIDTETNDGHRVRRTMMSFKQTWHALRDSHPGLQFFCTENQTEWSEKLQSAGLDPGLFGYQLIMNSREGGADELFRFNSPDDFIDFLLELTVEPSRADSITENLETFRKQLQRRKHEFMPDLTLSTGLVERLAPLAELHERRIRTSQEAARLVELHHQIRASIALNTQKFLDSEKDLANEIKALRSQYLSTEATMMQHRGVAVAVSMKLAERSLAAAQAEADKLGETVEQAQRDQTLWQAVYPYKDYVLALKEAQDYKEMLSGANDQREPLMEKLATVAADYVAAMKHQVGVLGADRDKIRKQCDEIEQNAYLVENRAVKLDGDAFAAESEAKSYSQNLQARQTKFESLIKLEIVQKGESPAAALERIETAQKTRKSRLRSIERNREGNAELQEECARLLSEYQRSSAQKQADLAALEREYSRGCDERDKLENDKGFLSLLEAESIDLDDLSDEAAGILARRASSCQENVARLRTEAAALERARVHIAEYGLMPPSVEVEALLKVIGREVHAQSGWSYFAHDLQADEDEKERLVRKFPEIAQGIIVPRNEIHRVVELIESSPSDIPKLPVVIAAPEALYEHRDSDFIRIVGPKDHASFQTGDAQKTLGDIEKQLEGIEAEIRVSDSERESYTNAANQFKIFRSKYARGWFATTQAKLAQGRVALEDDLARLEMQEDEKRRLSAAQKNDENDVIKLRNEIIGQESACSRLREFVDEVDNSVEIWKQNEAAKLAEAKNIRSQADDLRAQARSMRDQARSLLQTVEPIASKMSLLENDISGVKYVNQAVEPKQNSIESLKAEYHRLLDRVQHEFSNSEIVRSLEAAEKTAKKDLQQVKNIIRGVITLDDVKSAFEKLQNQNDIERNGEQASAFLDEVLRRKDEAIKTQTMCEATLTQRKNAWFGAGKPVVPDGVEIRESTVAEYNAFANDDAQKLVNINAQIADKEKISDRAKHARDALAKDLERLKSVQRSHAQVISESQLSFEDLPLLEPEDMGNAISDLETRLEAFRAVHASLDTDRKSYVSAIRKFVEKPEFAEIAAHNRIIGQFKVLDPDALENSAQEYRNSLDIRIRELTATLAEIEKHRNILAKLLLNAAEEGLRLLKLADSASTVPREVPDIGGSRFLRITTKEPPSPSDKLELIQELVDTLIDENVLPTGAKLIQRAVRQIAHPFTAKVLNPDPASPQRLIEITETARFSGGEQLTCAILLYCTLANVRARTRGMNRQPTSVLILDNPIGRASRTVFINMQRQFASAMGIQLIYTTAVNDLEALSILPNIVRLRNERTDLNKGHRLLEQDVDISGQLEAIRLAKNSDISHENDDPIDETDDFENKIDENDELSEDYPTDNLD